MRSYDLGAWLLLLFGAILAAAAAVAAFLAAAFVSNDTLILLTAGGLVLALVVGFFAWLASGQMAPRWRGLLALRLAIVPIAVVALVLSVLFLYPLDLPYLETAPPGDLRTWTLPTGSKIAYTYVAAAAPAKKDTPVIYLHGGAGVPGEPGGLLTRLTQDGFDVYHYDQLGSGLSGRAADVREYTVARHVADLEAIRQQIGAEKIVLVGHSWGSALAAHYMVAHPAHVARVVFVSPGPLALALYSDYADPEAMRRVPPQKTKALNSFVSAPRFRLWQALAGINLQAARNVASDREMDGVFQAMIQAQPSGRCDPALSDPVSGVGYYAFLATFADWQRVGDPRPALAANATPALILRGSCDYIKPEIAAGYKQTLPNATLVNINDAGHLLMLDQPDRYLSLIRAFLLGEPLP
jgi:proline iminopeptidase